MLKRQEEEDGSLNSTVSFCPSFNSYSTDKLVEIADKVSKESNAEKSKSKSEEKVSNYEDDEEEDDDDDFEFVTTGGGADVDSNRLFFNGEIRQVFPVFNRDLLSDDRGNEERHVAALKNLFIVDDDDDDGDHGRRASSASSSDEDEPEIQPNATFCIWSPKRNPSPSPSPSPSRCKKSNSTGSSSSSSSKKWFKFGDLLKRSNSDGKESFVFLNKPAKSSSSSNNNNNKNKVDSKEKKVKSGKTVSAHEAFYVKNRAIKEGDKKKSYLPYKQDLLGGFC